MLGVSLVWHGQTLRSLANVDEAALNTDLLEAAVTHVIVSEARGGPGALQGHEEKHDGDEGKPPGGAAAGAILIFTSGAEEVARICRAMQTSERLRKVRRPTWHYWNRDPMLVWQTGANICGKIGQTLSYWCQLAFACCGMDVQLTCLSAHRGPA
jgi:hypothetical protein